MGPLVAAVPYAPSYPIERTNNLWQTKTDRLFTAPTCVFWVVRSLAIRAHVSSPLWVIQQPAGPSPPPLMFVHKPSGVLLEWPHHFHIRLEHLNLAFKHTVNPHVPRDITYRKQSLLLLGHGNSYSYLIIYSVRWDNSVLKTCFRKYCSINNYVDMHKYLNITKMKNVVLFFLQYILRNSI